MKEFIKKAYDVTLVCKKESAIIGHVSAEGIKIISINISGDLNPLKILNSITILEKNLPM
ncbi:MAG: hypothetical protein KGZ85_13085 [Ignavibacterium sp.]|nr:hypothetical protein [Ignavibacterium sp.]